MQRKIKYPLATVMPYGPDDRTVHLEGDVHMDHYSGDQIVKRQQLNLPPLGELMPGRKTFLTCDRLDAVFSGASAPAAAGRTPMERIGLDKLRRIDAVGKRVDLDDGSLHLVGNDLRYDRAVEIIVMSGKPATLIRKDASGPPIRSPKIQVFLEGKKILRVEADQVEMK